MADQHSAAYAESERRIEEARQQGATELDLAKLGLTKLPESIGQLKTALDRLKGIADGFKQYKEIGDSFEAILKLVGPALGAMFGASF